MLGWVKRHWILSLLIIGVTYCTVPPMVHKAIDKKNNPDAYKPGYCHELGRWITNEEKILAALKVLNNMNEIAVRYEKYIPEKKQYGSGYKYFPQIKYESAEAYLKQHPDCCKVTKGDSQVQLDPGEWDIYDEYLDFDKVYHVNVKYIARYKDENNEIKSKTIDKRFYITNCGTVID